MKGRRVLSGTPVGDGLDPRHAGETLEELESCGEDYAAAKERLEAARIELEEMRDRFASVRLRADRAVSPSDLRRWKSRHPGIQYAGLRVVDAVFQVLRDHAAQSAESHWRSDGMVPYAPGMTISGIVAALQAGGFQFRSSTPQREVNAALIRAQVEKTGSQYETRDAGVVLDQERLAWETQQKEQRAGEVPF